MRGPASSRAAVLLALISTAATLTGCTSGHRAPAAATRTPITAVSTTTAPATTTTTATTVAPTTTSTTTDPGALPQTRQLPSAADPQFLARMADLLQAVSTGDAALAGPAFFPLDAYIQVKGISDPVHDYQTRLIPDYDQDIATLHAELASAARPLTMDRVSVPAAAEWILPGVEYNKGSYWRVYGARLWFTTGGQLHYFTIASLISWRGEWYVVHLNSIR